MHNVTEPLPKHYGTLQSVTERYEVVMGRYGTLQSVTGPLQSRYRTLHSVTEQWWNVTEASRKRYGTLWSVLEHNKALRYVIERYGGVTEPLRNVAGRYGSVMEAIRKRYGAVTDDHHCSLVPIIPVSHFQRPPPVSPRLCSSCGCALTIVHLGLLLECPLYTT